MKNRSSLWLLVFPALAAALILAGCKGTPEEPCLGCGVPPPPNCDTCGVDTCAVPPCDSVPPTNPPDPADTAKCATEGSNFTETASGLNIEMVFVRCGTKNIGCTTEQTNCQSNERPEHPVKLSSYYIGKIEVTQRQWKALMGTNPSDFAGDDNLPVEMVSWEDAQAFIAKLNERSSRKKYRLPTNAEWEYAARGGVKSMRYKYSGGNNVDDVAWYVENSGGKYTGNTQLVRTKTPNELGLHDMSGNVGELVGDFWADEYKRNVPASEPFVDPQGPLTGENRVVRGGNYTQAAEYCRVSARTYLAPADKRRFVGFRVALTAE